MRRLALVSLLAFAACEAPELGDEPEYSKEDFGKADSSALSTVLTFEFDGELLTDSSFATNNQLIQDQLLYTIGHLNWNNAVGRLDKLTLTNLVRSTENGKTKLKYHAKMPVAWGSKTNLPTSYAFKLPRDISYSALSSFTSKYKESCVDFAAHDVDQGSMWYYYRPQRSGCSISAAELYSFNASVSVSPTNTTGKYPEYHKVWQDNTLRMVAIFGKYEDGATTTSDAGVAAYNNFVSQMKSRLSMYQLVTVPATIPSSPGVGTPEVTMTATLADGKQVVVSGFLIDSVTNPGPTFNTKYSALTPTADIIIYNGHAGLGQNVRALARMGRWVAGQYLMMFMNGCDTFAYVDGHMAQTRAAINTDDPTGTKYMDIITNGMPSYFHSNPSNTVAFMNGLLSFASPKTYEEIFRNIDSAQFVLVSGEEDNVYYPGFSGGGGGVTPPGMEFEGDADQGEDLFFETGTLAAGNYTVTMTGPAGDADLYVRVGSRPTKTLYDCRPYDGGSNEECKVTLTSSTKIHIMVNGYAAGSNAFQIKVTGSAAPPPTSWTGMLETGSVVKDQEKRFQTPTLPVGRYTFSMTGTGDADLYVRTGAAPTTTSYECRPYSSGSTENCVINLNAAAPIHVMVRGYAASSTYRLEGKKAQ
jgi:hypothetical protein